MIVLPNASAYARAAGHTTELEVRFDNVQKGYFDTLCAAHKTKRSTFTRILCGDTRHTFHNLVQADTAHTFSGFPLNARYTSIKKNTVFRKKLPGYYKLTLSTEDKVSSAHFSKEKAHLVRRIVRKSKLLNRKYKIHLDLSVVKTYKRGEFYIEDNTLWLGEDYTLSYEVEIDTQAKPDYKTFLSAIDTVFRSNVPLQKYLRVVGDIGVLLAGEDGQSIHLKQNWVDKPVDLYARHAHVLVERSGHLSHKADGVRILLYFAEDGVYAINPFAQPYVTYISRKTSQYVHLYDAELYGEKDIIIFDTLFFEGEDVRVQNYSERLSYPKSLPTKVGAMKIHHKKTYSYTPETYEAAVQALLADKHFFDTDGYIATQEYPLQGDGKTYKIKPRDMLTVDFLVKSDPFRAYVEVPTMKTNVLAPVLLDVLEPEDGYADGDILEFSLHKKEGVFVFTKVRNRPDKNRPNFVGVLYSVLNIYDNTVDLTKVRHAQANTADVGNYVIAIDRYPSPFVGNETVVVGMPNVVSMPDIAKPKHFCERDVERSALHMQMFGHNKFLAQRQTLADIYARNKKYVDTIRMYPAYYESIDELETTLFDTAQCAQGVTFAKTLFVVEDGEVQEAHFTPTNLTIKEALISVTGKSPDLDTYTSEDEYRMACEEHALEGYAYYHYLSKLYNVSLRFFRKSYTIETSSVWLIVVADTVMQFENSLTL